MINVLSLFDGLSGARIALDKLGIKCKYYASEIDKYAIQVSKKNYPDIIQLGDITQVKASDLPQIDLLIGGSPCQDLSVAKKDRQGLVGARSGLFYEYVRLLKECKPKYFLLENVNSMPKESKKLISEILGVEPIMINSALLSAQNRKRLYWTNILGITQPDDKGIYLKNILEKDVDEKYFVKIIKNIIETTNYYQYDLSGKGYKSQDQRAYKLDGKHGTLAASSVQSKTGVCIRIGQIGKGGQGDRVYSQEGKSATLSANGGGRGAKIGLYCVAQRGRYNKDGSTSQKLEPRFNGKTNTLTNVQKDNYVADKSNIRKLTPIECERLQTISDNYTAMGINDKGEEVKISNTQRYKMIGNGFTCDVIAHILSFANWENF